jgi:nucleotide-binding universal stress UspA family protein
MSATLAATPTASTASPDAIRLGPVLVATDGSPSADAAIRAATHFAAPDGGGVAVLTVLEPIQLIAENYGVLQVPVDQEIAMRADQQLGNARSQLGAQGVRADWPLSLEHGDPARVVASAAATRGARMILLGLGHHNLIDRVFGNETALRVVRRASVPVFAVSSDFRDLPDSAVAAVDFSAPSTNAVRAALLLMPSLKRLHLVHVMPRLYEPPLSAGVWTSAFEADAVEGFAKMRRELGDTPGVSIETVTRYGTPVREVTAYADSIGAGVIICGSRGAGLMDRFLVGSTASAILRVAKRSVFIVPAATRSDLVRGGLPASSADDHLRWAKELAEFTRRNAGRRTKLEVDDPEFGAQFQESDYPLLGAAFDHHDQRVEIMLGDFAPGGRHLTRGIGDVRQLEVLRDTQGRDRVLRIGHGNGQTLLTLQW